MENSKAITNHDSSYPLRKWAVRSHWTHRSGDTTLPLFPVWFLAVGYSIPWIRSFDFFVSFTVGRDTGCMEGTMARHQCRTGEIGWVVGQGGERTGKLDRTRNWEERQRVCVSRSRVHWPKIILACRAVVPRRPLRYPIPCFVFFFILFIFPRGNQRTFLQHFLGSMRKRGHQKIISYYSIRLIFDEE